jgi:PAS domain S-box-containing protein
LANKAVADAYGTTVAHLIGKTDADFNPNLKEVKFFRKKDMEVMDSDEDRFVLEEPISDASGYTRWLQTIKRPIFDDQGRATMVLGVSTDITERKRVEEILRQREQDLRHAMEERERISQDLHDGILQSLYAIGLGLEACRPYIVQRHKNAPGKLAAAVDRTIGQLNHVMAEIRNFIEGLESQIMQGGEFANVVGTMVQAMAVAAEAVCRLSIQDAAARHISTEQALHLLNVVREAVSNSLRHGRAKRITISLKLLTRTIRLSVSDNGEGFNQTRVRSRGHGLPNMAARARKLGGRFAVRSKPGRGTKILLDLPKEELHVCR